MRLTPRVECYADELILDLAGCARLVALSAAATGRGDESETRTGAGTGEWAELAAALYQILRSVAPGKHDALRVTVAPTRTIAWLAAAIPGAASRQRVWRALDPEAATAFLRALPVASLLALPELAGHLGATDALDVLTRCGIQTGGQLARLPEAALRRRFGPLGPALVQLARGRDLAPLRVGVPEARLGVHLRSVQPLAPERVPARLQQLSEQLGRALALRHLSATVLTLTLSADYGPAWRVERRLSRPISTASALLQHAQRLLQHLTLRCEAAARCQAYSAIYLRVGGLRGVAPLQAGLWAAEWRVHPYLRRGRLLTAAMPLALRFGSAMVLRAVCAVPHAVLPEERHTLIPLDVAS
jgi:nucleotidyltransferase/DNA polymerase involved in DNA repair